MLRQVNNLHEFLHHHPDLRNAMTYTHATRHETAIRNLYQVAQERSAADFLPFYFFQIQGGWMYGRGGQIISKNADEKQSSTFSMTVEFVFPDGRPSVRGTAKNSASEVEAIGTASERVLAMLARAEGKKDPVSPCWPCPAYSTS